MSPQSRIRERSLSDLGNNFRHAACLLVPEVADGAGEGVPLEVDDHPDQIRPIGVALGHSLEFGDKVIKDLGHRSGSELHAAPPGDVVLIRTRRPDRKYPMFPGVERIVVNRITMPCCGQKPFRQFGEVSAAALVNRDRGVPLPGRSWAISSQVPITVAPVLGGQPSDGEPAAALAFAASDVELRDRIKTSDKDAEEVEQTSTPIPTEDTSILPATAYAG